MTSDFTVQYRTLAATCALVTVIALAIVSFQYVRAHAQNVDDEVTVSRSFEAGLVEDDLLRLSGEVKRFLDHASRILDTDQIARVSDSSKRQRLLLELSALQTSVTTLNLAPDQSRDLNNAIRELEDKLFRSQTQSSASAGSNAPQNPGVMKTTSAPQPAQPNATGMITGAVVDAGNAAGISNVAVDIFNASGNQVSASPTDNSGNYSAGSLPTGTYYVVTYNRKGYLDQLYNGKPCLVFQCLDNITVGTAVSVTDGSTTPNINFALQKGGAFSGKVTDAANSAPLKDIGLYTFDANGKRLESFGTDASGNYMTTGLPPGNYFVITASQLGYIDQLYNGFACVAQQCNPTAGTPIAVTTSTVPNINFALQKGGRISGTITDVVTHAPLPGVLVSIYDSFGNDAGFSFTNAAGTYTSGPGLPTGTYYVTAFPQDNHINQIYNGVPCPTGCTPILQGGTPISVTAPATTPGIDFALTPGGTISGKITDANSVPLQNVDVFIYNVNGGLWSFFGYTDASGVYSIPGRFPTGTYYAKTNNSGYIDQVYNGITCLSCDPTIGTPISVTAGAETKNINFVLQQGGSISGKVLDAVNNTGIFSTVEAFDTNGNLAGSASINNATGAYKINGLPAGTYYAITINKAGYIDQLYNGGQCAFQKCNPTSGTPIVVTLGVTTPNIDFALQRGGRVAGYVTNAANSVGISGATVRIYDANGSFVTSQDSFSNGLYVSGTGLPTGTYFARTSNDLGYLDQLYNGISCALGCSAKSGTPISVTAGTTVTNINFALQKGGTISGKVTDANTSAPVPNVFVDIYDGSGSFITNGVSNGAGNYTTFDGLPAGTYYALTSNSQGYINRLFNGIQCGLLCDPTTGTKIVVTVAANTPNINFSLTKGGTIGGKVTDAGSSAPLSSVSVNLYDASGTSVSTSLTNGAGTYSFTGLPPGTYFARATNSFGYINQLFSGIQCPFSSCTPTSGTPIVLSSGGTVSNINFGLQKGGTINGKVTDAANAQPLSAVSVHIYDATGKFVTSGTTNSLGIYVSSAGLPSGNYFARTSNSQGYVEQLYQGIQCAGCTVTTGTPIGATLGSTTSNINFALNKGGLVSGTVKKSGSSAAISDVFVDVYDATGHFVAEGITNDLGVYVTPTGLPSGAYFARTVNDQGYIDQLFSGIACPVGCAPASGTAFSVTAGSTTSNINFDLASAAATFQFSATNYLANEDALSATITVVRLGNLSGAATVDFNTSDSTATQRADYTLVSQTLTFAPGESAKTVAVLLSKDAFQENDETTGLSLSNPTGSAILGTPANATLTIGNDPLMPATINPNDDQKTFVIQHYHDFLNRQQDEPGLVFWTTGITACGADAACIVVKRINTSAAFFLSIEFQETGGFVIRLQRAAFGKKSADSATRLNYLQFVHDARQVGDGVVVNQTGFEQKLELNKQNYANQIVTSSAFTTAYAAAVTADQFVTALFNSAGVTPTVAEKQAAVTAFGAGDTAGRVAALRSVADSNSIKQAEFSPSFVLLQYFGYLRRNPTDAPDNNDSGYQFWLTKLNSFGGDFQKAEMVKAFISSSEYRSRFGQP
jgi:hypothetical protein